MKATISQEEFEGLNEKFQAVYTKDKVEEGESQTYTVDAIEALGLAERSISHKDRAVDSRKKMEEKLEELTAKQQKALEDSGNFEELYKHEKAAKETLAEKVEKLKAEKIEGKKEKALSVTVKELNKELCGTEKKIVEKELRRRLKVILDENGNEITVVLDENGEHTSKSKEDLLKEFRENEELQPLLAGRDSSGGGAGGGAGAGAGGSKWADAFNPEKPNFTKQAQLRKEDPALFSKLQKEYLDARRKK